MLIGDQDETELKHEAECLEDGVEGLVLCSVLVRQSGVETTLVLIPQK